MVEKLKEGIDYYLDASGLYVFTRDYHLKRGYCCESGCKHCPYGHENTLSENLNKGDVL